MVSFVVNLYIVIMQSKCFGCGIFIYLGRGKSFSYGIATERNKTFETLFRSAEKIFFAVGVKTSNLVELIFAV